MERLVQIEAADRQLLTAIDDAAVEASRRSGAWLLCRLGCTQCCLGPFAITQLDAMRLRAGLTRLAMTDGQRAESVRARARMYVSAIAGSYPGNAVSGELYDEEALPESMDDVACPALDPATGCCDLYEARPVTCRTFGPAARLDAVTYGACELCYVGASEADIAACAVEFDPAGLEQHLVRSMEATGVRGQTIIAYALLAP